MVIDPDLLSLVQYLLDDLEHLLLIVGTVSVAMVMSVGGVHYPCSDQEISVFSSAEPLNSLPVKDVFSSRSLVEYVPILVDYITQDSTP